ncbi:MAG: DUF47 family protein [Chloroflexi bacterium]|nr:DUF47 family protein [Chloroflexota bacterium]
MKRLKWFGRSKQDKFLRLLSEQAEHTQKGLEGLHAYMRQPDEEVARQLHAVEKDADETRRILID